MTAERPKPLLNHVIAAITGCFTNTTQWRGLEERAIHLDESIRSANHGPHASPAITFGPVAGILAEPELLS